MNLIKFQCVMYQSIFQISESIFELITLFFNNSGVGFMHTWRGVLVLDILIRQSLYLKFRSGYPRRTTDTLAHMCLLRKNAEYNIIKI